MAGKNEKVEIDIEINKKDPKYDVGRFRKLMKSGIGTRTQAEFAKQTGVSKEHLNRLLNGKTFSRPSEMTLRAFASKMDTVSEDELLNACGYNVPSLKDRVVREAESIRKGLDAMLDRPPSVWPSAEDFIDMLAMLYSEEKSKIRCGSPMPHSGRAAAETRPEGNTAGTAKILVEIRLDGKTELFRSYFAFYYAELNDGRIIPCGYSISTEDLLSCGIEKKLPGVRFQEGFALPTAVIRGNRNGAEERLLRAIFGFGGEDSEKYVRFTCGYGFYWPETLDTGKFAAWLTKHRASYCTSPERAEVYQKIILPGVDVEKILSGDSGDNVSPPYVVSEILSRETDVEFDCLAPFEPAGEGDGNDPEWGTCIMHAEPDGEEVFIPDDIKNVLYETCRDLGIKTFGTVWHRNLCRKTAEQAYDVSEYHIEYRH